MGYRELDCPPQQKKKKNNTPHLLSLELLCFLVLLAPVRLGANKGTDIFHSLKVVSQRFNPSMAPAPLTSR